MTARSGTRRSATRRQAPLTGARLWRRSSSRPASSILTATQPTRPGKLPGRFLCADLRTTDSGKIFRPLGLPKNESRISQRIQPGTEPGYGDAGVHAYRSTAAGFSDVDGKVLRGCSPRDDGG